MRRISTVLVVLSMLAMCTTSFGFFLIYNVSTSVKGVDSYADTKAAVPLKGYLLINFDIDGEPIDGNLILYGKDANVPVKQKVYVIFNYGSEESLDVDTTEADLGGQFFMDIIGSGNLSFSILLGGKLVSKDVGLDENVVLPPSLKGNIQVRGGYLLGPSTSQDIWGTANISVTLNNLYTMYVNAEPAWTQDDIIYGKDVEGVTRGLIPDLAAKGYVSGMPIF